MATPSKSSITTTDHAVIKQWIEERNGKPTALRKNSNRGKDGASLLRIDFPGGAEDSLEAVSWEEFFDKFEKYELAFQFRRDEKSGETSFFYEFADRNANQDDEQKGAEKS
jgi:hypothetical protein